VVNHPTIADLFRRRYTPPGVMWEVAEHAIERAMRAEKLLRDILPMAMWESCMYKDHPDANPCTHCCDWNDFVERIKEVLGDGDHQRQGG
jgi:hypothetical protein